MKLANKLRIAMINLGVTQVELARRTGQSQANLSKKFCNDNFNLREFERLVTALGCELEIKIKLPSGEVVQ